MRQNGIEVSCRPVIMDAVCSSGTKCFHNTHYLYQAQNEMPIPGDACIINCRVNHLNVTEVRRIGDCYRLTGSYRARVWFEYTDTTQVPPAREVTWAEKTVNFIVSVPANDIDGGCVLCNGQTPEVCWIPTKLHCVEACLEMNPDPYSVFQWRIRVVVEKEFFVMETGRSIICLPACPPEECIQIPEPTQPIECPTCYEEPAECREWCAEDDEESPGNCAQCPPPQVEG